MSKLTQILKRILLPVFFFNLGFFQIRFHSKELDVDVHSDDQHFYLPETNIKNINFYLITYESII